MRSGLQRPRLWMCMGFLIVAFITVTCLMPARDVPDVGTYDKVIHAFFYTVLAFWFASILQRRHLLRLLLVLGAFGGLIELAQEAMHLGRHAEWADLLADVIGAAAGVALASTPLGRWPDLVESTFRRVFA
jgi:VanZ family protein